MTSSPVFSRPLFVCLSLFAALILPAAAQVSNINPVADSFVTPGSDGSLGGNNYGAAGIMGLAPAGKTQGEFQSLLRFDLAATKAAFDAQFGVGQWTLASVTLQLTAAPANNAILNEPSAGSFAASWMQNDSWVEGTGNPNTPTTTGITFDTLSSFLGGGDEALGTFAYSGATSGATIYTLSLTSGFGADLAAGNLVSLRLHAADSNVSYLFNTRNFNTAASRPVLTVTAVPEPGIWFLLGSGVFLVAVAALKRWRLDTWKA